MSREVANAHLAVEDARARIRESAYLEARACLEAELAAHYLVRRAREEQRADETIHHPMSIGLELAEWLLATPVPVDPRRGFRLAQEALWDARHARSIVIEVSAIDLERLASHLAILELPEACLELRPAMLAAGQLVLHLHMDGVDRIHLRLDLLGDALRAALGAK